MSLEDLVYELKNEIHKLQDSVQELKHQNNQIENDILDLQKQNCTNAEQISIVAKYVKNLP